MLYRDASGADAQALAALARDTFVDTFAHLYPPADLAAFLAETYGAEIQAREIADPETRHRLAERGGVLLGFAKMGAYKLPHSTDGRSARELHRLYVVEAAKGAGVADALMRWTLEQAEGADDLYLGVFCDNHRAQRFYARYGFEPVGEYIFMVGQTRDREFILRRRMR